MTALSYIRDIANSTIGMNKTIATLDELLQEARATSLAYTALHLEEAKAAVEQARTQVRYAILAAEENR